MLLITAILDIIVSYNLTALNYNEAYNLKNDSLSFIWKLSEPWKYKGYLTDSVCFIIFFIYFIYRLNTKESINRY